MKARTRNEVGLRDDTAQEKRRMKKTGVLSGVLVALLFVYAIVGLYRRGR
jgi:hypothetical protein